MPLGLGSAAGPYKILRLLGSGGMGTVYLARDTRLDRRIALKVLHDAPDTSARARLLHEARAASALNHPNICQLYDVGEHDGLPWIAMEYVEGRPLEQMIPAGGLDPDEALRIAIQIADALAHAHARGIVHRDLKPPNVACDVDGRTRILDFGIAGRLPRDVAGQVTRSESLAGVGTLVGTLPYMAPEVLKGAPADERSDLWSLGVMLHEMISGNRPFHGDTALALASSILSEAPEQLPAIVPQGVAATVARLLAKNPADRFRSAAEARAAFEALRAGAPSPRVAGKRGRGLWIGLAAALATGVASWVWIRGAADGSLSLTNQRLLSVSGRGERFPALSPDGSHLAFVTANADGVPQIFVRNLTSDTAVQITSSSEPASRPRWTPSGDHVIYSASGGIWRVPQLGGEPTRLIERGTNPNLSRDGPRLVYERDRRIWTAALDGSDQRPVPGVPPKYYSIPSGPAFSPDGQWIAYFRPDKGPNGDLWIVPAGGGTPRQLTNDLREGGWPVWTPDGRWIVFSSARAGSRTLWQVPAAGGEPIPLTTGAGEDDEPELAADGSRIVYSNVRHNWDLRVRDLATGSERVLLERRTEVLFPRFSPDGRHLTFFGRADYAVAIWTMDVDGTSLKQLTASRELNHMPRWAPGGDAIYFYQAAPTVSFRRIPAAGGASTEFRKWTWEEQTEAGFDPTGRFIAYTRERPLDRPSDQPVVVMIQDAETGGERALHSEHSHMGRWSPDGREIAVWRHDGRVWRCEVEASRCQVVTEGTKPAWSGDGQRIYVMRGPAEAAEVWSVDRQGGDERLEASLGSFRSADRHVDVSRDGLLAWAPWHPGEPALWTATLR